MSQVRTGIGHTLFFCFIAVMAGGCSDGNNDSVFNADSGHPAGWLTSHGGQFLSDHGECTECHGTDLLGGISDISCNSTHVQGISCHPGNDAPHLATLLSADGSVHPDNSALFCGKCHDMNDFHNDLKYECQRCHADPDNATDPINGTLKTRYPGSFPYGFGSAQKVVTHSSLAVGTEYGNWNADCVVCHNPHAQEQDNRLGTSFGKLIKETIRFDNPVTGDLIEETIALTEAAGPGSFADGAPHYGNICEVCHTRTLHHRQSGTAPGDIDINGVYMGHYDGYTCTFCHPHSAGFKAICGQCHDVPPPTGTHLKHFGGTAGQAAYGSTESTQDVTPLGTVYIMNCGNCHPMDLSRHINGVPNSGGGSAEIELYDPAAAPGSLKAMNPSIATYTPGAALFQDAHGMAYTEGTCDNVYCHSYNESSTTGAIPTPTFVPPYTLIYNPPWESLVVKTRQYMRPQWGVDSLGCDGCHGYPIITEFPAVSAGAGDSHGWLDDFGNVDLHVWNMGFGPLQCRTCHWDTVQSAALWTQDNVGNTTFDDIPIFNTSVHVNGFTDIAFTPNPVLYQRAGGDVYHDLSGASYDPQTTTCSNVSCHLQQTQVVWGSPYRWWEGFECNICHRI